MKRALYVDGSNLYGGITDILNPGDYFDFSELLKIIERDITFSKVMFYGTYMRDATEKGFISQQIIRAQRSFFNSAKNNPKVIFCEGHFSGSGKEKGVDVRLAVDMVYDSATGKYEEIAIMTGDADLTYAVEMARRIGLPTHLVAFGSRFPYAISFKANRRYVYDYQRFFQDEVLPNFRNKPRHLLIHDITENLKVISESNFSMINKKRPDA